MSLVTTTYFSYCSPDNTVERVVMQLQTTYDFRPDADMRLAGRNIVQASELSEFTAG